MQRTILMERDSVAYNKLLKKIPCNEIVLFNRKESRLTTERIPPTTLEVGVSCAILLMKFTKLSTCEGAERFGTCIECGKGSKEDPEMFKITWDGNSSIILCKKCAIKLKNKL